MDMFIFFKKRNHQQEIPRRDKIAETISSFFWMKIDEIQKESNLSSGPFQDICLWTLFYYSTANELERHLLKNDVLQANISSLKEMMGNTFETIGGAKFFQELVSVFLSDFETSGCSTSSIDDIQRLCMIAFQSAYPDSIYDAIVQFNLFSGVTSSVAFVCELLAAPKP